MIVPAMCAEPARRGQAEAIVGLAPRVARARRGPRRAPAHVGGVVRAATTCSLLPVVTVPPFPHDHDADMWSRTIEIDGESRSLVSTIDWLGLIGIVGLPSAVVADRPHGRRASRSACRSWRPYLHDRRAVRAAQLVGDGARAVTRCRPGF